MKIFALFLIITIYSCSEKPVIKKELKNDFYDKAWEYFEKGDNLNAFIEFGKAKDLFLKNKDTLGTGKCFMNMAIIQEQMGDDFGSQETATNAINYFDEKNIKHHGYIATNYNTLGITASKLKNYSKSIEFYQSALKFASNLKDKIIYQNNLANNYSKSRNYIQAIKIFSNTIKLDDHQDISYSRTLTNLATTKWLQNPNYDPIPEFNQALKIRIREKNSWGLNSSYSHLADYYLKSKPDSALSYAKKMYNVSKQIESPDDQIDALQKLISLDTPKNSKRYFKVYQKINDSLQTARNKAKNQFALIRYETEKNKADFLKAKAESTERQNYIIKQYFALGFTLVIILGLYIYLKRRQKILRQEKLIEVKNTELKYSKKVHDRVANRIYQIMSQVENTNIVDRNALLFGLENVYETSRDISYDNKDINENQNFFEQIQNMLNSYSSDFVKLIYTGNHENLWNGINFQTKTEIYLILQELMTNMKKHSKADKVFLKFERQETDINISYTDNGIGIEKLSPKNGLQNMENRINAINGKIIFDTEIKNLLKINISFPV